ncbi:MAG TPA: carboxypeptidase-like regulatory domain-containing protein, partial [Methanocella sp.]|nr:carboxypeptidase-like regulatory domain-containing protein [Methanocella sp.]
MSRKAYVIIGLLVCLFFTPATLAEEPQNKTLYWSPVSIAFPSPSFTVEDAQNINYSIYDELGAQSVHVSVITAQLYLNGAPYHAANIPITFSSDNDSVAVLEPNNRTRPSDANGQAKILLIARNRAGLVNITAESEIIPGHRLSDTCTVRVVGWGTVSGIVTDQNRNGIPGANVTLWLWNGTANTEMLAAHDNPQLSNDGRTAAVGMYTFVYVPVGSYNVTAEKEGHSYYRLFDLHEGQGTITANVAIP